MMREDYKIYGDMVIFDTTYRTNRYNFICGPILGINNFSSTIMFGCAFIARKSTHLNWFLENLRTL